MDKTITLTIDDIDKRIQDTIESMTKADNPITDKINKEFTLGECYAYLNLLHDSEYIDDFIRIYEKYQATLNQYTKDINDLYKEV